MKTAEELRLEIANLVQEFADLKYTEKTFKPGRSVVPPSGKVMGATELQYMVDASLDGWLTTGRFNRKFEKELSFKIKAFKKYKSEVMKFPHPRSIESIENLAIHRGIESGLQKAEAFELIRSIFD